MEEEKVVRQLSCANRYAPLNREISMHLPSKEDDLMADEDLIQVPTDKCTTAKKKKKNKCTTAKKKKKNKPAIFGPPKPIGDQRDLKVNTSEECIGSALKEKNPIASDPLDIKKKDAPPLSVGGKKAKKNYAPQSNIEKRVKRIIKKAKGVTDDGDPIDKDVLKKFILEIEESEGFYFSKFPGYIFLEDVPNIYPYLIDGRYDSPEVYAKSIFLATLAVAQYNKNHATYFKVVEIEHHNVSLFRNYITFSAIEVRGAKKGISWRLFIHALFFSIILSLFRGGFFWRKVSKLTREWSLHLFKANEDDLQDKNAVRATFRTLVGCLPCEQPEVVFCRLFK